MFTSIKIIIVPPHPVLTPFPKQRCFFRRFPRLRQFVILVRITSRWRWVWSNGRTILTGESGKYLEKNLSQCHFFHQTSQTGSSGIEHRPPQWEVGEITTWVMSRSMTTNNIGDLWAWISAKKCTSRFSCHRTVKTLRFGGKTNRLKLWGNNQYLTWKIHNVMKTISAKHRNFNVTVKFYHYRLEAALRAPGEGGSKISRQSASEGGKDVNSTHRPHLPHRR